MKFLFFVAFIFLNTFPAFGQIFQSSICGKVYSIGHYTAEEELIVKKAYCLANQLKPQNSPNLELNFSALFKAHSVEEGKCYGLTVWHQNQVKIYILASMPKNDKDLMSYLQLGTTLIHELHHFWTGSMDDGSDNDPFHLFDDPIIDQTMREVDLPSEKTICELEGQTKVLRNRFQEKACNCNIKFW